MGEVNSSSQALEINLSTRVVKFRKWLEVKENKAETQLGRMSQSPQQTGRSLPEGKRHMPELQQELVKWKMTGRN